MDNITQGAFVDSDFPKGYILDEERIRKINEILITRGQQIGSGLKPTFKVYKADTFSYSTDDIQKILSEKNADWEKIVRLTFLMKLDNVFLLELDFDHSKVKLHIEGDDRDIVFLIFSELKQYISNEVATTPRIMSEKTQKMVGGVFYLVIMLSFLFMVPNTIFGDTTQKITKVEALNSQDIQIKLDFLIQKSSDPSSYNSFLYPMAAFIIFMVFSIFGGDVLLRPIKYLYPDYLFLIGKEIERNSKRLALKQNILWGVIISSIIGIITGLIVWFVTK